MPSALEGLKRPVPIGKIGVVGRRCLPKTKVNYFGRTPKDEAFRTIWPPVNCGDRAVIDKSQELMQMYYSRILDDEYVNREKPNLAKSFRLQLENVPKEDKEKYTKRYIMPPEKWPTLWASAKAGMWKCNRNSVPLFATLGKPTCGYYFSFNTDHKKRLIGIPPSNLVKWRSNNRYF